MSDKTLVPLWEQVRLLRPDLRARCGVRSSGVFGARARGEQDPNSDLDLHVEFDDLP